MRKRRKNWKKGKRRKNREKRNRKKEKKSILLPSLRPRFQVAEIWRGFGPKAKNDHLHQNEPRGTYAQLVLEVHPHGALDESAQGGERFHRNPRWFHQVIPVWALRGWDLF